MSVGDTPGFESARRRRGGLGAGLARRCQAFLLLIVETRGEPSVSHDRGSSHRCELTSRSLAECSAALAERATPATQPRHGTRTHLAPGSIDKRPVRGETTSAERRFCHKSAPVGDSARRFRFTSLGQKTNGIGSVTNREILRSAWMEYLQARRPCTRPRQAQEG
jgi:hypothetical protein